VFGAGASISEGAPLQKDVLRLICDSTDNELESSDAAGLVKQFLVDNFSLSSGHSPSLESVFGYLDYFLSKQEGLGKEYPTARIREIREALILLIHYVIGLPQSSRNGVYRAFWETVSTVNRNVSVITMNYDTLLDEAFDFLYPDSSLIDYCLELMNYHHYPEIGAFNWWINPREPVSVWEGGDPVPIKLIKIHGSLNWKYCNCCNQVLLTPWDTKIGLSSMSFKGYIFPSCENPDTVAFDLVCPLDGNKFDTFIVPPSHIKDLSHPAINKLLDEAALEIRKAKKIVFVGYSFPEADVHIKALIKKNIRDGVEIHVVDPHLNGSIEANYRSLSEDAIFHKQTFGEFIATDLVAILRGAQQGAPSDGIDSATLCQDRA
jgi:hypothetical protein